MESVKQREREAWREPNVVHEQNIVPEPSVLLEPEDVPIPDADDRVIKIWADQMIDFDASSTEMSVKTVTQKISHLQWRRVFKELWGSPTTTADFRSSFRQIPYTSHVCLLEDKMQD